MLVLWPNAEYFTDMFRVNLYVTSSKKWFFWKRFLYGWLYVRAFVLFRHTSYNRCLTFCISLTFSGGFLSIAVPSSWKSSGSPIFSHCVFCGNMFCLTNWTKLFRYFFVFFFTNISFSGQYLRFCCVLVSALLSGVDEAVFLQELVFGCSSRSIFGSARCYWPVSSDQLIIVGLIEDFYWNGSGTLEKLTLKVWIAIWISP